MMQIDESQLSRPRLMVLALLCMIGYILMCIVQLMHAMFGSKSRALRMAVAIDQCGNAATGGDEDETMSSRTGKAFLAGKPWAKRLAPCIDFFFGKGHCVDNIGI